MLGDNFQSGKTTLMRIMLEIITTLMMMMMMRMMMMMMMMMMIRTEKLQARGTGSPRGGHTNGL